MKSFQSGFLSVIGLDSIFMDFPSFVSDGEMFCAGLTAKSPVCL